MSSLSKDLQQETMSALGNDPQFNEPPVSEDMEKRTELQRETMNALENNQLNEVTTTDNIEKSIARRGSLIHAEWTREKRSLESTIDEVCMTSPECSLSFFLSFILPFYFYISL